MTATTSQPRIPAGVPAGGEFGRRAGQRSSVELVDTPPQATPIRQNGRDPHRFDIAIAFPERDHTSISQLTTWQRCQLQWALQQHGIDEAPPEEPTAAKRYSSAVERRDRGISFHTAADATITNGHTPAELDADTAALVDNWRRAEPDVAHCDSRPEVEIRGHLLDESTGELVAFVGYADRVDRLPDGTVRVVDYKTGSPPSLTVDIKPDSDGVRRYQQPPTAGLSRADLQLLTYADQLDDDVTTIRTIYPTAGRNAGPLVIDRDVTDANRAHARAVTSHLLAQLNHAERDGTVTTSDGTGCTTCGYHRHCPQQGGEPPSHVLRSNP